MGRLCSLALLFIAGVLSSTAQTTTEGGLPATAPAAPTPVPAAEDPADIVVYYNVTRNLTLTCDLPRGSDEKYVWTKNGTEVSAVPELKGHFALSGEGDVKYSVKERAREDDYGRYECAAGGRRRTFDVRGQLHLKLPADTNVVEGQKLKLTCKLIGRPYPERVAWGYTQAEDDNATFGPLGAHARLAASEQGVADAELVIEAAEREHAGRYECRAAAPGPAAPPARTTLRVKDKYAALWPFIGICAEVFVLCAIILVYEKRRTKPEQEDSDTDNHDTKKS